MLIYANKTGYPTEETFEAMKDLIRIPIVYVAHDNLTEFMQDFFDVETIL